MFIVMAGEARGSIYDSKKSAYTEVAIYKRWDCFGEKAILSDEPRDMTVTTLTECTLAILSKVGIQRLMGSLESL
jgi:CRP-like cAMP-binding protein